MEESQGRPGAGAGASPRLWGFGEALPRIKDHFTLEGALGVISIDASRLGVIERQYGTEAHQRSIADLGPDILC